VRRGEVWLADALLDEVCAAIAVALGCERD
jgi:hypothetical protein